MQKAVAKGEVIMSTVDRAKNNGRNLPAATSKLDTKTYSVAVKIGTGYVSSLPNFSVNNCKNRVRVVL